MTRDPSKTETPTQDVNATLRTLLVRSAREIERLRAELAERAPSSTEPIARETSAWP